ncbi:hypothetical protein KNU14_gp83 [Gordonia phage Buggaboo]|uniref:Uncharacterized protein n=1 Tax=Gordonia phage Buggaboo TaxID=2315529 RepID=A0A386KCG5_9CAUD|nr:hypothetical protein KNU14_gp83 [Gordonia phage Buggaboo]AVE00735.1 hypothetical protein SEA_SUPERSULLEY_83 [Gordonia phage SuperSulley]AYD83275.1 hypothetical protein SEA_BUGGABOO_83 [Gordonia phage Buggaboo]
MLISTDTGIASTVTTRTRYAYGSTTATGTPRTCEVIVRSGYGAGAIPADLDAVRAGDLAPQAWNVAPTDTREYTVTRFITASAAQREVTSLRRAGFNAQRDARSTPADYKRRNGPGAYYTGPDVVRLVARTNRVFVAWRRQGITWWDDVTVIDHGAYYTHRNGVREIGHVGDYCDAVRADGALTFDDVPTITVDRDNRAAGVRLYGRDLAAIATCGACGRRWDDAHVSSVTPTPSGRCPFEYDHGQPIARWY